MNKRNNMRNRNKTVSIIQFNPNTGYYNTYDLGGTIGAVGGGLTSILGAGVSNAAIEDTGDLKKSIKNATSTMVNNVAGTSNFDQLTSQWGAWDPADNVKYSDIRGGSDAIRIGSTLGATAQGAMSGLTIGGPIGAAIGGVLGLGSSIFGWNKGNKKARKETKKINSLVNQQNSLALSALGNRAETIDTQNDLNMLANYIAYGGEINTMSDGGSIHIRPENRGKFNATKKRTGKTTEELTHSKNPLTRKRAIFAQNAAKWNHAYGGELNTMADGGHTHGSDWDNGITTFDNGNTHEQNPNGGVMIGTDEQGVPNMVEQGEVKWKDYIFSDRMKAKEKDLERVGLPKKHSKKTYGEIAKSLGRESEERPNDPISKNGLESSMTKLAILQENDRMKKQQRQQRNMFALGGPTIEDIQNVNPYASVTTRNINTVIPSYGEIDMNTFVPPNNASGSNSGLGLEALRYAPILGSGINTLTDLFGLTNKPDYTSANLVGRAGENLSVAKATPIGDYLTYRPFDRNYYLNQLGAQAGATRRNIINTSGGNRAAATAGLLAADYNTTGAVGKMAREAEEYNQAQRERVSAFNRGTNMFNTESALRADQINKQNDEIRLRARMGEAQLRDQQDMRASAGRSANLSNLFNSIGDVGREEFSRNMIQTNPALYYTVDRSGNVSYKNDYYSLSPQEKAAIDKHAAATASRNKRNKDKYITIKG